MENNKVSVKIYGQEYVISGESSRENIIRVADYVDMKMHEIAGAAVGASLASVATLTAVNIADEFFTAKEKVEELTAAKNAAEKDAKHYVELWDEAKQSTMQYKTDFSNMTAQKDELMRSLNEKENELNELKESTRQAEENERSSKAAEIEELRAKCKELENSFFDLQMENIRLKSEVERYKRTV